MHDTHLHFIHTAAFESDCRRIPILDHELRSLETALGLHPARGDLVVGAGGIRKVRLAVKGRGKRGGARVLYYHVTRRATIYLLKAYDKTVHQDLTAAGKKYLTRLVTLLEAEEG